MTIYQIDNDIQNVLEVMVDPETGEISDDALAELTRLNIDRQNKIENIALYIKNLLSDAAAIKAEEESLYQRRKGAESNATRLKKYLSDVMPGETMETARVKISWRKSTQVKIDDESDFISRYSESGYLTYKDPTINKNAVSNALKSGEELLGASLVTNQNIQVK